MFFFSLHANAILFFKNFENPLNTVVQEKQYMKPLTHSDEDSDFKWRTKLGMK